MHVHNARAHPKSITHTHTHTHIHADHSCELCSACPTCTYRTAAPCATCATCASCPPYTLYVIPPQQNQYCMKALQRPVEHSRVNCPKKSSRSREKRKRQPVRGGQGPGPSSAPQMIREQGKRNLVRTCARCLQPQRLHDKRKRACRDCLGPPSDMHRVQTVKSRTREQCPRLS